MSKEIIQSSKVPAPIGPYSQAVIANGFLFASGQIAFNPTNGELVLTDIQSETRQVMENIKAILDEANYFTGQCPARETLAVKTLPRNVNIEVSITAVVDL